MHGDMSVVYRVMPTLSMAEVVESYATNCPKQFEFETEEEGDTPGIMGTVILLGATSFAEMNLRMDEDALQDLGLRPTSLRTSSFVVIQSSTTREVWLEGLYRTDQRGLLHPVAATAPLRKLAERR